MSLEIYGLILLVGLFVFICFGFPISFTLIALVPMMTTRSRTTSAGTLPSMTAESVTLGRRPQPWKSSSIE